MYPYHTPFSAPTTPHISRRQAILPMTAAVNTTSWSPPCHLTVWQRYFKKAIVKATTNLLWQTISLQKLAGTRKNSLLLLITVAKGSEGSSTSLLWLGSHTERQDLHHSTPVQHSKLLWHLLSLIHKAQLARQPLDFLGGRWTKMEGESSTTEQVNTTGFLPS